jgi:hypothetical protein
VGFGVKDGTGLFISFNCAAGTCGFYWSLVFLFLFPAVLVIGEGGVVVELESFEKF